MTNKTIEAVTVERDEYGFWSHPLYPDHEMLEREWQQWLDSHNLEHYYSWLECSNDLNAVNHYLAHQTFAKWNPEKPAGKGWFIGSIHDTEDSPVCVWLRQKGVGNDE